MKKNTEKCKIQGKKERQKKKIQGKKLSYFFPEPGNVLQKEGNKRK